METAAAFVKSFDSSQYELLEEPRLREQDFGNFQDPVRIKEEQKLRSKFGTFYYRCG
jgi:broad specificity phosphatase PhoE